MTDQNQTIISPSTRRVLARMKQQDEKIAGLENHIRLDGRRIAELEGENQRLYQAWKEAADANDKFLQIASQAHDLVKMQMDIADHLRNEVAQLTAELTECQQAFDNGRAVEQSIRAGGYGELGY